MPDEWEGRLETIREREGLRSGWILAVGLGTAIFLAATMAGLWAFFNIVGHADTWPPPARYAGPDLQSDPAGDLRTFLDGQVAKLHSYGWVDRQRGVIQVPIERAMEIVAARGAAAYDPPAGTPPPDQAADAPNSRRPGP